MPRLSSLERFWAKVDKTDTCWLWTAAKYDGGYGACWLKNRKSRSHRVSYILHKGPIPEGLTIDHLCRVRHCVNPDHLEAVTHRENTLRGVGPSAVNARKTHCIRGHELSESNLYIAPKTGKRQCVTCHKMRNNRWYAKNIKETRMDTPTAQKTKIELIQDLCALEMQLVRQEAIKDKLDIFKNDMIEAFGFNVYRAGVQGTEGKIVKLTRDIKKLRKIVEG